MSSARAQVADSTAAAKGRQRRKNLVLIIITTSATPSLHRSSEFLPDIMNPLLVKAKPNLMGSEYDLPCRIGIITVSAFDNERQALLAVCRAYDCSCLVDASMFGQARIVEARDELAQILVDVRTRRNCV